MRLSDKLNEDLKSAMLAREEVKVSTLRFLLSDLNNAKIAKGKELEEDEVIAEIQKEAKKHQESINAYKNGGREDLVAKEEEELGIIKTYLPEPYSEEQLKTMVDEAVLAVDAKGVTDMGKVIKAVMSSNSGRADGARVAQLVKEKLSQQ